MEGNICVAFAVMDINPDCRIENTQLEIIKLENVALVGIHVNTHNYMNP